MGRVLLGFFLFGLAGCSTFPTDPVVCTAQFVPGIVVRISDVRGGVPESASVTARDGDFVQTEPAQRFPNGARLEASLAGERPGTYTVTVNAPGYNTYSQSGIRVTRGVCHVRTVELDAQLTPSS
jgi:hypothetical protein